MRSDLRSFEYLNLLLKFQNYSHSKLIIDKLLNEVKTYDMKTILKNLSKSVDILNPHLEYNVFAPVVIIDKNQKYPVLIPLKVNFSENETIIYKENIANVIRKAVVVVEKYFAQKEIIIDLNPNKIILENFDEIEKIFSLDCESLELPIAVLLYLAVTNRYVEDKFCFTGAFDFEGNLLEVDFIEEKKYCFDKEIKEGIFVYPDKKLKNFKEVIKNVFGDYTETVDKRFLSGVERMFNIAENYLLKSDKNSYLPIYHNLEAYLKNREDIKSKNYYFLVLSRLALHYNQSGDILTAENYFKRANDTKNELIKEKLFEYNNISIEFNNVYAVFLKDIYRFKEGLKLLKLNLEEKKYTGKHLSISTYGTLSQYLIHNKDFKKAEKYLLNNLEFCKKYLTSDVSRVCCYLAKLNTLKGNYNNSKKYIGLAENYLKKATPENIQKVFIHFEKIRLNAHLGKSEEVKFLWEDFFELVKDTRFYYMYYLAIEYYAFSFLETDQEMSKKLYYYFFKKMKEFEKEDYLLFGIRGLLTYYIKYKDEDVMEDIIKNLKGLKLFKQTFCRYIKFLNAKNIEKIRELSDLINLI
ncbi:MAG: hypothetical protein ABIN39_02820 [candidate division WOR-3 bacterium]